MRALPKFDMRNRDRQAPDLFLSEMEAWRSWFGKVIVTMDSYAYLYDYRHQRMTKTIVLTCV